MSHTAESSSDADWDMGPPPGSPPGSFMTMSRPMYSAQAPLPTNSPPIPSTQAQLPVQTAGVDFSPRNNLRPYSQYNHSRRMSSGFDTMVSGTSGAYSDGQQQNGQGYDTPYAASSTVRIQGYPDPGSHKRPHLDRLEVAYYRLYWEPRTPLPSREPLYSDDPSLSSFNIEHVPPPRLAENYMAYICNREGIHISRAKLYIDTRSSTGEGGGIRLIQKEEVIQRGPGVCGSAENHPYMLTVEMDSGDGGNVDRDAAARPLAIWVQGGRGAASGLHSFFSYLGTVFGCGK